MSAALRLAIVTFVAAGALVVLAPRASSAALPREVTITVHHSRFSPDRIEVPAGVPVTFTIRNEDPIDHEWLVGDDAFHARHRTGGEAAHGDRPDEVSLPAFATRTTTLAFAPGTLTFICHFPRHEAYGMVGLLTAR